MQAPFFRSEVLKVTVYLVATMILGALISPPLFLGCKWLVAQGTLEGGVFDALNAALERSKFSRFFNRAMLIAAMVMIYPTVRWIRSGLSEAQAVRSDIALQKNAWRWQYLALGFVLALLPLLLMGWGYVKVGYYKPRSVEDFEWSKVLIKALTAAAGAAILEELFFRWGLMNLVLRAARPFRALLFVTFVYTLVHFLKPPPDLALPPVTWSSGFWMIGQIFAQFGNPIFVMAEFATLFTVGWILGYVRLKTRSLWLGIGLHAGWIFGIKVFSPITRKKMAIADMLPWAGQDLKTGIIPMVVVLLTGVVVWLVLRKYYTRSAFVAGARD
ncbi:MAG: CPBP family intramembrane metalloprotease [Verrucomicrobiales bacterium]|nr:CPBP family intramembrane metalloprotease [Verrucomicrobiales bacterium]